MSSFHSTRPLCAPISTAPALKKDGRDQAIGRSRGGLSTKIHAVVDALGNPLALSITQGQVHDIKEALPLLEQVEAAAVLADKGYDSDALIASLEARGITAVIPPKSNRKEPRKTDFALYRERHLVECFFGKLKQYRGIATRFDKLANTFIAGVQLVCVLIWLN
jgi:transposase